MTKEQKAQYQREYFQKNKARMSKYRNMKMREYRKQLSPEQVARIKAYQKKYRIEHRAELIARTKAWNLAHNHRRLKTERMERKPYTKRRDPTRCDKCEILLVSQYAVGHNDVTCGMCLKLQ